MALRVYFNAITAVRGMQYLHPIGTLIFRLEAMRAVLVEREIAFLLLLRGK
jgi:hypothetical protein